MEDKELKELFLNLKREGSKNIPDFDDILNRPVRKKGRRILLIPIFRWTAAAAAVLLITVLSFRYFTNKPNDNQLAEIPAEEKNILNWEPKTDILLPTEFTKSEKSESNPQDITVPKNDVKEIVDNNPELKEDLYKYGAISDWNPPSDALMPFDNYNDNFDNFSL